jgi:hypothetical protein
VGSPDHAVRQRLAVAIDHIAMQIVAATCVRSPFVTDERGESSRVLLHDRRILPPSVFHVDRVLDFLRKLVVALGPGAFRSSPFPPLLPA